MITKCEKCNEIKQIKALGLCKSCYRKEWKNKLDKTDHQKFLEQKNSWRNGGVRTTKRVYKKFNSQCAICGSQEDLTIHHIDNKGRNAKRKNNTLNNLVLLCRSCHTKETLKRRYGNNLLDDPKVVPLPIFGSAKRLLPAHLPGAWCKCIAPQEGVVEVANAH